jgi:drug/metabolite transporter (DMT)-like permease
MYALAKVSGEYIPFSQIPFETWATLAYMVGAGSIVAFIAFIYSMKNLEPGIASLYAYINPIVAILVGSLLVDEKLTLNILIGSLITLFGVYLVNKSLKALR